MKIAIIQISEAGNDIAKTLIRELSAMTIERKEVGKLWQKYDAFVFIGAMGICVRTIAPYVKDKHEDPAVVWACSQSSKRAAAGPSSSRGLRR